MTTLLIPFFFIFVKMKKTYNDHEFGDILLEKKSNMKNIRLRITNEGLKISLPLLSSYQNAIDFFNANREKVAQLLNNKKQLSVDLYNLQTITFSVCHQYHEKSNIVFSKKDHILTIFTPNNLDKNDESVLKIVRPNLINLLQKEAQSYLPPLVFKLAKEHHFNYTHILINKSRTHWGSCSVQKHINLSCFLMQTTPELVEYVILHELCHTIEMNHSPRFWELMEKVCPGAKNKRNQLKKYKMI